MSGSGRFAIRPVVAGFGSVIYCVVAVALAVVAFAIIVASLWDVWKAVRGDGEIIASMLNTVGLIVVALAVFDVSKYLIEEEVLRGREIRSIAEARLRLTKFLTIITIAISLEALVFIFNAGKQSFAELLYPTFLVVAVVLLVIGLGLYQWLSSRSERVQADIDSD